jgi:hypothetical protein
MRVQVVEHADRIVCRVRPSRPADREALSHFFYRDDGEWMTKEFAKANLVADVDAGTLEANLRRSMRAMCDQFNETIAVPWQTACADLLRRLEELDVDFWVCGSAALALRGLRLTPHDIDVMTTLDQASRIAAAFAEQTVEPFGRTDGWVARGFGVVYLGCKVDIAMDPVPDADDEIHHDFGWTSMQHLEEIDWNGHRVRVPRVEYHRPSNVARGRADRVAEIDAFLARHPG